MKRTNSEISPDSSNKKQKTESLKSTDKILTAIRARTKFSISQSITRLDLCAQDIDDLQVRILANSLELNASLTSLELAHNKIGPSGAKGLSDALRFNKTLTFLDLGFNEIGKAGAGGLSEWLAINPVLERLCLQGNPISSAGATLLAGALKTNSTLTELNLDTAQICDSGATSLHEALKANITLTTLTLTGNSISESLLKKIDAELVTNKEPNPTKRLRVKQEVHTPDRAYRSLPSSAQKSLPRLLTPESKYLERTLSSSAHKFQFRDRTGFYTEEPVRTGRRLNLHVQKSDQTIDMAVTVNSLEQLREDIANTLFCKSNFKLQCFDNSSRKYVPVGALQDLQDNAKLRVIAEW